MGPIMASLLPQALPVLPGMATRRSPQDPWPSRMVACNAHSGIECYAKPDGGCQAQLGIKYFYVLVIPMIFRRPSRGQEHRSIFLCNCPEMQPAWKCLFSGFKSTNMTYAEWQNLAAPCRHISHLISGEGDYFQARLQGLAPSQLSTCLDDVFLPEPVGPVSLIAESCHGLVISLASGQDNYPRSTILANNRWKCFQCLDCPGSKALSCRHCQFFSMWFRWLCDDMALKDRLAGYTLKDFARVIEARVQGERGRLALRGQLRQAQTAGRPVHDRCPSGRIAAEECSQAECSRRQSEDKDLGQHCAVRELAERENEPRSSRDSPNPQRQPRVQETHAAAPERPTTPQNPRHGTNADRDGRQGGSLQLRRSKPPGPSRRDHAPTASRREGSKKRKSSSAQRLRPFTGERPETCEVSETAKTASGHWLDNFDMGGADEGAERPNDENRGEAGLILGGGQVSGVVECATCGSATVADVPCRLGGDPDATARLCRNCRGSERIEQGAENRPESVDAQPEENETRPAQPSGDAREPANGAKATTSSAVFRQCYSCRRIKVVQSFPGFELLPNQTQLICQDCRAGAKRATAATPVQSTATKRRCSLCATVKRADEFMPYSTHLNKKQRYACLQCSSKTSMVVERVGTRKPDFQLPLE
eukprot:evm.model.scf_507.2 EVM.evm.TU.scf_507.2   scf_507:14235-18798(+)